MEDNIIERGPGGVGAEEAGRFVRHRRIDLGLTLADVVSRTTVPNIPYLSRIESGQVNLNRSKHLASLVPVLRLTPGEVSRLTGLPGPASQQKDTTTAEPLPDPLARLLHLEPRRLAAALILAGEVQDSPIGAYRFAEDPTQDPNLTIFMEKINRARSQMEHPKEPPLEVGAHYVGIDQERFKAIRVQCVDGPDGPVLIGDMRVLEPSKVSIVGRIIFEGRAL
jgi:transcriptional regulator with XRE-family HTH domain